MLAISTAVPFTFGINTAHAQSRLTATFKFATYPEIGVSHNITLRFSESVKDFEATDITVTGGTVIRITGGGNVRFILFTPNAATYTLSLAANSVTTFAIPIVKGPANAVTGRGTAEMDREGSVEIAGTPPRVGRELVASVSDPSGSGGVLVIEWQWQSIDSEDITSIITGATSQRYTPVEDDIGKTLQVSVNYLDGISGNRIVTSAATDAVEAAAPVTTAPPVPAITTTSATVNTASFTIEGTAEAGTTVALLKGGVPTGDTETAAAVTGTFSFTVTLTEGANSFTATASDGVNTSAASSPVVITLDTVAPTITVNEPSFSVELGGTYAEFTFTANDNTDGNISSNVAVDGYPADTNTAGTYNITFDVSDDAGNAAVQVTRTVTVTPDTTAPPVPVITTPTATVGSTPITINGGSTEAGATVELFNGTTSAGTTTADGSGNFSFTVTLTEGENSFTATASDGVNTSDASSPVIITLDTVVPMVTLGTIAEGVIGTAQMHTITFTEEVTGLAAGDFSVSNNIVASGDLVVNSVTSASGPGTTYTISITPQATAFTLTLAADSVMDTAAAPNTGPANAASASGSTTAALAFAAAPALTTNNADPQRAKEGDELKLTFTVNVALASVPVVSIAGQPITATGTAGNAYSAAYTVLAADVTDGATVSYSTGTLTAAGPAGNTAQINGDSAIRIDLSAPAITLTGGDAPVVLTAGGTYTEPGATATDNVDASVPTPTPSGAVDPNTPADYPITYTATDRAGNVATRTRTVTVSEPAATAPEPPVLSAGTITDTSVVLEWTAVDNADSYTLTRVVAGGANVVVASDITELTATDTGLTADTPYKYTITATNSAGTSTSTEFSARTDAAPVTTPAPTVTVERLPDNSIEVSWDHIPGVDFTIYAIKTGVADVVIIDLVTSPHTIATTDSLFNTANNADGIGVRGFAEGNPVGDHSAPITSDEVPDEAPAVTDTTPPTVTLGTIAEGVIGTAQDYDITFSEAVTGLAVGDFSVSSNIVASGDLVVNSVTPASGPSATYTIIPRATAFTLTLTANSVMDTAAPANMGPATAASASGSATAVLALTAPDDQSYTVGTAITALVLPAATGGTGTLTYTLTGALPTGLTFTAASRTLSGTPTAVTSATTLTYTVTDANGASTSQTFTVTVNDGVVLTAPDDQGYTVDTAIDALILPAASGGTGTLSYALTGPAGDALPGGLTFAAGTRTLSGTPTAADVTVLTYTVTDTNGATATADFAVTVNTGLTLTAPDNQSYTVNTAIDALVLLEASGGTAPLNYTLTGLNSADLSEVPGLTFTAGTRTLSGTPTAVTSATTLTYTVTDANGATASQTFMVTVNEARTPPPPRPTDPTPEPDPEPEPNTAPVADAGAPPIAAEGATVTLSGRGSSDPDDDTLTYAWRQTGGTSVSLSGANTATPGFTAPSLLSADAELVFRLTVSDGSLSATDTVTVTVTHVNDAPGADAGEPQTVAEGAAVTLRGTGTDPDGDDAALRYAWSQTDTGAPRVSLSGADTATPGFTAPSLLSADAELVFRLTVSDGSLSATDTVTITVTRPLDTVAPVITLRGDSPLDVNQGATYTDPGATASDDRDGDLNSADIALGGDTVDTDTVGEYTVTYDVSDAADNAAVTVTRIVRVVVARDLTALNEAILPEVARDIADRNVSAIARRIEQARQPSRTGSSAGLGGASSLAEIAKSQGRTVADGQFDLQRLLSKSNFVLPLSATGAGAADGAQLTLWGAGDYRDLKGADGVRWSGDLLSLQLGLDAHLNERTILGVSVSKSQVELNYTNPGPAAGGNYDLDMTSVHPYLGWTAGGLDFWATLGYGEGELEISADGAQTDIASSDLSMQTLGLGANGVLMATGTTTVLLKTEALSTQLEVDASEEITAITQQAHRVRMTLEAIRGHSLDSGAQLETSLEAGLRYDGGDGETGAGAGVGWWPALCER